MHTVASCISARVSDEEREIIGIPQKHKRYMKPTHTDTHTHTQNPTLTHSLTHSHSHTLTLTLTFSKLPKRLLPTTSLVRLRSHYPPHALFWVKFYTRSHKHTALANHKL